MARLWLNLVTIVALACLVLNAVSETAVRIQDDNSQVLFGKQCAVAPEHVQLCPGWF